MKQAKTEAVTDRRSFLKLASVGAATGGAALVAGGEAVGASEAKERPSLYRETEHIRRYYELAR
jgi:hypothetical protein